MLFRRKNKYLEKFVEFCKRKFGDNLAAIVVFGSYAQGFFDKKKSDYDIFIIFRDKIPQGKIELKKKFPKVSVSYFLTLDDLMKRAHLGHFTSYITLLTKGSITLYKTKEYKKFLRKLKKKNLLEEVVDVVRMEHKTKYEKNILNKL